MNISQRNTRLGGALGSDQPPTGDRLAGVRAAIILVLDALSDAADHDERQAIAKMIAALTPSGGRPLAELAREALESAQEPADA